MITPEIGDLIKHDSAGIAIIEDKRREPNCSYDVYRLVWLKNGEAMEITQYSFGFSHWSRAGS